MRRRDVLSLPPALLAPGTALAQERRLTVVELFTSQGCSSCPPADAVLAELARTRPDVLPLSFHVTYWNRLGWRDRFSLEEATERQRRYARWLGRASAYPGSVYTPQAVVGGRRDAVGSDRTALLAAIRAAAGAEGPSVRVTVRDGNAVAEVGAGPGAGTLWLVGFDRMHETAVGAGENAGRRLSHVNVVRGVRSAGAWRGEVLRVTAPVPAGERVTALLQAEDGAILGAALGA